MLYDANNYLKRTTVGNPDHSLIDELTSPITWSKKDIIYITLFKFVVFGSIYYLLKVHWCVCFTRNLYGYGVNTQGCKYGKLEQGLVIMVFKATFHQYFSYMLTVSIIGGGKPRTCRKSLKKLSDKDVSRTPRHERD